MSAKPTNRLEESLVKAALDPAHRPQFYRDLLASDIYVIQEGPPPDRPGHRVLPAGELLKIRTLSFNGKQYVPIFSSRAALQAALSEEAAYLALNAAEFFRITAGADVVLNPGWDHGKEFSKEEIAGLLDGSIWQPRERFEVKRDTTVQIGQPARHPKELVETLSRLFTAIPEVRRAYVALLYNPERDERPHTLVAIEASGNWESVIARAGMVASAVEVPDPPVDFIPLTGGSGIEEYFGNECQPFYQRLLG